MKVTPVSIGLTGIRNSINKNKAQFKRQTSTNSLNAIPNDKFESNLSFKGDIHDALCVGNMDFINQALNGSLEDINKPAKVSYYDQGEVKETIPYLPLEFLSRHSHIDCSRYYNPSSQWNRTSTKLMSDEERVEVLKKTY